MTNEQLEHLKDLIDVYGYKVADTTYWYIDGVEDPGTHNIPLIRHENKMRQEEAYNELIDYVKKLVG